MYVINCNHCGDKGCGLCKIKNNKSSILSKMTVCFCSGIAKIGKSAENKAYAIKVKNGYHLSFIPSHTHKKEWKRNE